MKDHYDFSNAVRGKFHVADAVFRLPVHLDEAIERYLVAAANEEGVELSVLVNRWLQNEIDRRRLG